LDIAGNFNLNNFSNYKPKAVVSLFLGVNDFLIGLQRYRRVSGENQYHILCEEFFVIFAELAIVNIQNKINVNFGGKLFEVHFDDVF
jgi:hypothetical protein